MRRRACAAFIVLGARAIRYNLTMDTDKRMWIVAGPPGAGKTSLVRRLFPDWIDTSRHIDADDPDGLTDADDVAEGLTRRVAPVSKRLEIADLAGRGFVVESRLLRRKPLSAAIRMRRRGWRVALIYLALPKIELCRQRIRARVSRGGADLDNEMLERAFAAAHGNLAHYIDAAERWLILDSSGVRAPRIAFGSYAAAVATQPDALTALLRDYPFMPAAASLRADPWVNPIEAEFARLARWQSTLDHLIGIAERMEDQRTP